MNIALVGYGKMGEKIEELALERGHSISHKINSHNKEEDWSNCDLAIEFSHPDAAVDNIYRAIESKTPIVVGTTGWHEKFEEIQLKIIETNGALFYASNFSLGVNIFYQINQTLARLMSVQNSYKVKIEETHHTQKLDAPSGTAIVLADQIIANHSAYSEWSMEAKEKNDIPIVSKRIDNVTGDHVIRYQNEIDNIEIKHSAKNRNGFALGAILAAEFLINRKGIYSMNDLLNF